MLKKIFTTLAFIALTGTAQASSLLDIKAATFELYRDGQPICSGQFVSPSEFLTAAHCLEDYSKHKYAVIKSGTGIATAYSLVPNKVLPDYDTATLTLTSKDTKMPFVDIAETKPYIGDDLLIAGYPGVQEYFMETRGTFQDEVPMPEGFHMTTGEDQYLIYIYAIPGSSGSGVYKKIGEDYQLIGTEHGGPNDFMNFTSTIEGVRQAL